MADHRHDRAFRARVRAHLAALYPTAEVDQLVDAALDAVGIDGPDPGAPPPRAALADRWDERTVVLIAYADSVVDPPRAPLAVLAELAADELAELVTVVHVLPFFPSSSDRGFAVIDHRRVDPAFGTWADLAALRDHVDVMVDLVVNHVSSRSAWFQQFLAGRAPGCGYFLAVDPDTDLSAVVRPRALPLLHPFETAAGIVHVWCTFSRDQVDLDLSNPEVALELLRTVDLLVAHGATFLRLDAIAYLGKQIGTPCIHLPFTHEFVRLLRTLLERRAPRLAIVTETNVPSAENLSYLGTGDEAHAVYNFTLPPLVVDALVRSQADRLTAWLAAQPPLPAGCTFVNFLSSHDGIGVRPLEGILTDAEIDQLVELSHRSGGTHSSYVRAGELRPYELDTTLWDLLGGTVDGPDDRRLARFVCAHTILFGLAGIPALYVNSVFAVPNDAAAAEASGVARDISRARVGLGPLRETLADPTSDPARVLEALRTLVRIRSRHRAFHPDSPQVVLDLGPEVLAFARCSVDGRDRVVAVHNVTARPVRVELGAAARRHVELGRAVDLLTGTAAPATGIIELDAYGSVWLGTESDPAPPVG